MLRLVEWTKTLISNIYQKIKISLKMHTEMNTIILIYHSPADICQWEDNILGQIWGRIRQWAPWRVIPTSAWRCTTTLKPRRHRLGRGLNAWSRIKIWKRRISSVFLSTVQAAFYRRRRTCSTPSHRESWVRFYRCASPRWFSQLYRLLGWISGKIFS